MINEKPQESESFVFPYYAYADKNLTVPANAESYVTLTFSSAISWGNLMITALIQTGSCYVNVQPISNTTALIRVWNYAGSSLTGIVRAMALLPINATMSLS